MKVTEQTVRYFESDMQRVGYVAPAFKATVTTNGGASSIKLNLEGTEILSLTYVQYRTLVKFLNEVDAAIAVK